jgi:hypothetical protein
LYQFIGVSVIRHSVSDPFKIAYAPESLGQISAVEVASETENVFRASLKITFDMSHNVVDGAFSIGHILHVIRAEINAHRAAKLDYSVDVFVTKISCVRENAVAIRM